MVLISQGRGIVVFFIFIAACFAGMALTILWITPTFGIVGDDRIVNLAIAVSTFLSGIAIYPFGRFVMKPRAGQPNAHPSIDTFCFIDIKYWAHIFMVLTVVMLGVSLIF